MDWQGQQAIGQSSSVPWVCRQLLTQGNAKTDPCKALNVCVTYHTLNTRNTLSHSVDKNREKRALPVPWHGNNREIATGPVMEPVRSPTYVLSIWRLILWLAPWPQETIPIPRACHSAEIHWETNPLLQNMHYWGGTRTGSGTELLSCLQEIPQGLTNKPDFILRWEHWFGW